MNSEALFSALRHVQFHNWRSFSVRDVVSDSRQVEPGDVFVAIRGVSVDGHRFIQEALGKGAVACVVERRVPALGDVPVAVVPNAREAYAWLQASLRGFPGRRLKVIGVTGTDGKTTTVRLITAILQAAGYAVGCVDSVSASIAGKSIPTGFHTTTPDAAEVQAYLAEMVAAGMEYGVLESTSHGLAQHRVTGAEFDVAVVTNITHEHLDFHGSLEAYRQAKAELFRALSTSWRKPGVPKVAVLNVDDSSYEFLRPFAADLRVTYGVQKQAMIRAADVQVEPQGLGLTVLTPKGRVRLFSPLMGAYNVYNILAAAAVAYSQQVPLEAVRSGVATVSGVTGRMERIDCGQPFAAIVDFAHTPNALEQALDAVRQVTRGRVIVVFGCAGLRDRAKRPWMGEIAGRLADLTVITAEDPRTESLDDIMEQIAQGCRKAGRKEGDGFVRIADRAQAIEWALGQARPGDLVIVTGKGHERSMCFGTTEYPWSDHEAIIRGLERLGYHFEGKRAPD